MFGTLPTTRSRLSKKDFQTLPQTGLLNELDVTFVEETPSATLLLPPRTASTINPKIIQSTISFDDVIIEGTKRTEGIERIERIEGTEETEILSQPSKVTLKDIERELLRYGYKTISRIQASDGSGSDYVKYIKSLNKYGQYVFVELDSQDTIVTVDENEVTHLDTETVCEIPSSLQNQASCTSSQLIKSQRAVDTRALLSGDKLAHPVIRLSEIRDNPQASLEYENKLVTEMRNSSYANLVEELYKMSTSINKMVEEFNLFNIVRNQLAKDVKDSLALNRTVGNSGNVSDQDYELKRLQALNEIVTDLILCTRKIVEGKPTVDALTKEITNARKQCEREYEDVAIQYGA